MLSLLYIEFIIKQIEFLIENRNYLLNEEDTSMNKETIESVISGFKTHSESITIFNNKTYTSVKSPRREFRVNLISNDRISNRPFQIKIRAPEFFNLHSLNVVCQNYIFSDLLSYLSTLNLILREIDR